MIAALLVAALAVPDPRVPIVELELADRPVEALEKVERTLADDPSAARSLGFPYLRAHLLDELGRRAEANRGFLETIGTTPTLAAYARYRLAVNQKRGGHPEVAAGLLATLLGSNPPQPLVPAAVDLLVDTIAGGGECRLLAGIERWRVPAAERRRLTLSRADCELGLGRRAEAERLLLGLLESRTEDDAARSAAERLHALLDGRDPETRELALTLGVTFHFHRQFDRSTGYLSFGLGRVLEPPEGELDTHLDNLYALARGHFWSGNYLLAATAFGQVASLASQPEARARALYQQARCYELYGEWEPASGSYRRALAADPRGRWAPAALFSTLRILWRSGTEAEALELFEAMGVRRDWAGLKSRAALFLAASDLVRGRTDRSGAWLETAAAHRAVQPTETAYWRGRLAELQNLPDAAAAAYAEAIREAPYHPLAASAEVRAKASPLADATDRLARRLARSRSSADLAIAWRLLGDDDPTGERARQEIERRLATNARAQPYLAITPPLPAEWPLWKASLRQPEEVLLALGIWGQGAPAIARHFPVDRPELGFAGSQLLARGGEARRSLRQAEILGQRIPAEMPQALVARSLRRLVYPLPYRAAIEAEASRWGVDPYLVAAVIREESRFDPRALSAASARGLTQFVLPTARELGGRLGMERLEAENLYQPAISIALGAAYLGELEERFGVGSPAAVAAYNAGPEQARLWQAYCFSREPEEYLAKVGFDETRRYLTRVLTSRNQYREIYSAAGSAGGETSAVGSRVPTTSPGGDSGGASK